ncbi:hypothetical protein [uncultured Aquimarina sp.]|nr:hypothetical protein [uncultured Aquimarina sp.]
MITMHFLVFIQKLHTKVSCFRNELIDSIKEALISTDLSELSDQE